MNIKKAIFIGALLWVIIFFEVSILMFGFELEKTSLYIVHYISSLFLVSFVSWLYFRGRTGNIKEGFFLGVILVIAGIILDALITVPLFVKDYGFFIDPYLWGGIIETLIIAIIFGAIKK